MSDAGGLLEPIVGDDQWARHRALEQLREQGAPPDRIERLAEALSSDDASTRAGARMALAALADPASPARDQALPVLLQRLEDPDVDLRILAASALGESGNAGAGDPLVGALEDDDPNVAAAAADALGELRYAAALEPLAKAAQADSFWVRAAAVVALGRLEDERVIPALERVSRTAGLERPVIEALRHLHHPDALPVLAVVQERAPLEALVAAGAILAAHPELEVPDWARQRAQEQEETLRDRLVQEDDPAVARALGLAASPGALHTLLELLGPPRRSEVALTGLLAVPGEVRSGPILDRLAEADREELVTLLSILPPQTDPERVDELVPLLGHEDVTVRAAAAEAMARAPSTHSLPLLADQLDRQGVAPEVVRALGELGDVACGALLPLLGDASAEVRSAAADALNRCGGDAIAGALEQALSQESNDRVRQSLLRGLAACAGTRAVAVLKEALEDPNPEVRLAAIEGLGATGSEDAVEPLRGPLEGPQPEALAAIRALEDLGFPATASVLQPCLWSEDVEQRRAAARAVGAVGGALDPEVVEALARDDDPWVRVYAARILASRGDDARATLVRMADHDPDPSVRSEARRVLERMR